MVWLSKGEEMREKVLGWYRTFKHKVLWVPGYSKKAMVILLSLLLIDLVVLYFIW